MLPDCGPIKSEFICLKHSEKREQSINIKYYGVSAMLYQASEKEHSSHVKWFENIKIKITKNN